MNKAYDTIVAMRNTSSKTEKIALLAKQKNNPFLKEYLRMMYEPRVNFYVKKVEPKYATSSTSVRLDDDTLTWLKKNICTRKVSGDAARIAIANKWNGMSKEDKELFELLISRDAKAGFGASTINKVWSDLITDVPYMRCCLPKDAKLHEFPWRDGVFSQLKCDGMFANVTKTVDGDITIASRSGSPFPVEMFDSLVRAIEVQVAPGTQLHGELLVYKGNELLPRQLSNGHLNSIQQGGEIEDGHEIVFVAWDMIPEKEAKAKNKYRVPYKQRFQELAKVANSTGKALQLITFKIVYSYNEAQQHYKEMLEAGFEGTIIKHPEMVWEDTTSKKQVKMKLEAECDLKIVGFNPGKGKNEVLFGSIQCESSDGKLEVGVSGFDDKLRKQLWEDRNQIVGKIMTVKSNCLMAPSKEGGKYSLFLPRYEEIRLDKKQADSLTKIVKQFEAAIDSVA